MTIYSKSVMYAIYKKITVTVTHTSIKKEFVICGVSYPSI